MPHPKKGTPEHDAWSKKLSELRKGRPAHNKGKPMSEAQKAKQSAARKGVKQRPEVVEKRAAALRGKKRTPEQCAKIGAIHKGKVVSAEARKNISRSAKGRKPPITGKHHTPQTKAKMSAAAHARWERMNSEDKAKKSESLQEAARDITESWIENAYAQRLEAQGIIYERQKRIGWYRVDFYVPAENRIIEVNGCYWHACEQCNHIREDFEKKREADKKRYDYLRRKGYTVEIVWEHQLPRKPQKPP